MIVEAHDDGSRDIYIVRNVKSVEYTAKLRTHDEDRLSSLSVDVIGDEVINKHLNPWEALTK